MEDERFEFTEDELIQALLEATEEAEDDGVMTGPELQEALGVSARVLRKRIKRLIDAGLITWGVTKRMTVTGYMTRIRGYKLVKSNNSTNTN